MSLEGKGEKNRPWRLFADGEMNGEIGALAVDGYIRQKHVIRQFNGRPD